MGKIFFQGNIRFCACRRYGADFYNDIKAGIGTSAYGIQPVMARIPQTLFASTTLIIFFKRTNNVFFIINQYKLNFSETTGAPSCMP